MTVGGTFATALFRALIVGVVAGLASAVGVYASTDEMKPVIVAFIGGFLGSAAVRGLVEGSVDSSRQRSGDVALADVQAGAKGEA